MPENRPGLTAASARPQMWLLALSGAAKPVFDALMTGFSGPNVT
ncbi:hypothetical protein [Henriciella litoralis]|nr:hypothetical protein [Henriciella litoralis]